MGLSGNKGCRATIFAFRQEGNHPLKSRCQAAELLKLCPKHGRWLCGVSGKSYPKCNDCSERPRQFFWKTLPIKLGQVRHLTNQSRGLRIKHSRPPPECSGSP